MRSRSNTFGHAAMRPSPTWATRRRPGVRSASSTPTSATTGSAQSTGAEHSNSGAAMTKPVLWTRLRTRWAVLSHYQRFEGFVALVLTLVIGLVILVALFRLTFSVVTGLLLGLLDPLDPGVFQTVFGEILTLLIALEFNHTLQYVVKREQSNARGHRDLRCGSRSRERPS